MSPFVLLPAAVGAAWAGITRRQRLATLLLAVAVAAVILPYIWLFAFPPAFD